ncbi:bifunctional adenosylcobinamide kinase/adenosylcobinamide-phosphate guanylyltransferase [Pseudomaricurvus alkylphenolicus]|jgi:adenosylcobinamide kinase/adenosylcobinamide-phosphate guanylyltransferase|uniref:bifunctional adenosylcobinamide kinase/adenosylcobinamide-phosphate guanylyltransferase n=1 Tax=Pseudomaricurvus alkylphenolicus TaxID=1306991 RepID=UPI00142179C7|nr:bifunctional adenosylcobinamide kinase/adenosylcobinamide-phosphate guanylyltransferase [Pseudomaricurvus alkylphenolicus]NIB39972.1 bifunctional adenosylcobinamide kinase/adenosylcobinamide-phosphate guanylyltransferase [Pseudomaricurvus alkylphenolicus]
MKQLIFGGARSGKSRLAEQLCELQGDSVAYIATADPRFHDDEMQARVRHHRNQRPAHWQTIEEPLELGARLLQLDGQVDAIMVDCLTLWLSNCLLLRSEDYAEGEAWTKQRAALLEALTQVTTPVTLVSNEVGMGIVPLGEINRRFVDESGFLNQACAGLCDRVIFTAAGLPMVLKGPPLS